MAVPILGFSQSPSRARFNHRAFADRNFFRGGTAFHKLYLKPQARYSENIDLVQIKEESIGPILDRLRENLLFLGDKPKREQSKHNNTLFYRFESEIAPVINAIKSRD